jgi:monoamine oxidase
LSVLTDEDQLAGACLAPRVRLGGRTLTPDEVRILYERMARALAALSQTARTVFTTPSSIKQPWTVAKARTLDALTIDDWIQSVDRDPRSDLGAALRLEFSNDNAVAANRQSLLAVLALIAGGGFEGYWEDTEVYRCEDGNQALATRLAAQLTSVSPTASIQYEIVREVNIVDTHIDVVSIPQASGARQRTAHHDYAIVAVPPSVWPAISAGGWRFPAPVQMGPAVKYLAEVQSRYWIQPGMAPNGIDDQLGQLWEGTDNQMGSSGIDLTVFAGGPLASAVGHTPPRTYFAPKLETLLPGFQHNSTGRFAFADWPREPFIQTGYACPAPGQVTGVLPALLQPLGGRVFLAGEHTSPAFFGYMEGALQSGVDAALRVAAAAGIPIPPAPSGPLCPQRAMSRVV